MAVFVVAFFIAVVSGNGIAVEKGVPGHDWNSPVQSDK